MDLIFLYILLHPLAKKEKPHQKFISNTAEMMGFGLETECSNQEEENV